MTSQVKNKAIYGLLLWAQRLLFACAVVLLGYCAFGLTESMIFQRRQTVALETLRDGHVSNDARSDAPPETIQADDRNGLIGRMEVRRLGISVVVMEGSDDRTLSHAAGHIAGTSLPGEGGNVGIAGHRDTFFRPLRNIRGDDLITLTTPEGRYDYRVVSTRIVGPDEVSVLESDDSEILTLVTCYPFYFVGPSPDRFIVRAARIHNSEVGANRSLAPDVHQLLPQAF